MKALMMLVACAVAMGANSKVTTKTIGGEEVVAGPSFTASELVTITGLKFYACKLKRNDADCTVIVGYATCHLPHQNYVVMLTFDMWQAYRNLVGSGTIAVEIDRPKPGTPIRFEAVGPAWYSAQARGEDRRATNAQYSIHASARPYRPPEFKPQHQAPSATPLGRCQRLPLQRNPSADHP